MNMLFFSVLHVSKELWKTEVPSGILTNLSKQTQLSMIKLSNLNKNLQQF